MSTYPCRSERACGSLLVIIAFASTTGCNRTWRTYEGELRPSTETALVRLPANVVGGSLIVNDIVCPHDWVTRFEVLPGRHEVEWGYRHSNRFVSTHTIHFDAQAGDDLRLRQTFWRAAGPLGPIGDLITLGVEAAFTPIAWLLPAGEEPPPGRFHAWMTAVDGRVIGGDPPDLPMGYVDVSYVTIDDLP